MLIYGSIKENKVTNKFKIKSVLDKHEKCTVCGIGNLFQFTDTQEFYHKGKLLSTLFYYSSCDNCYSDIATESQVEANLRSIELEKSCY